MRLGGGAAGSCWLLLTLSLKDILADDWTVHLPSSPICAVVGSSVVLPCSYEYPQSSNGSKEELQLPPRGEGHYKVLSEMWCLEESRCITPRYVFHSSGILLDPSYHNRVEYLGQPGTKNCTLRISDVRQSDSGTYVFYLITSHPAQKMPEQRGVQLLVADSSTAVTVLSSPPRGITEGEALRLACCSPAAGPRALFRWYRGTGVRVAHTGQVWTISKVTSGESGSYYCQLQTGEDVHNSTILPVDVEYSPRDTVVSVSHPGELQVGFPVTLTCSSDAKPAVHAYVWYQGAACLPAADKSLHAARQSPAATTGRDLTRSSANISTEEGGLHCCVARNRHGSQTDSVTVGKSRAATTSTNTFVIIGVSVSVLLAATAMMAFFILRRRTSSRQHSYVLTAATATPL